MADVGLPIRVGTWLAYGSLPEVLASARTAANRSRTPRSAIFRVMNTTRLVAVAIRPAFEFDRRMREVLDVLHHDRPAAAGDIENALHAQQVGAAQRDQRLHGARKCRPFDRLGQFDHEARDAVGCSASATKPERSSGRRLDDAVRIERAADRDVDRRARIELLQAPRQPLDRGRRPRDRSSRSPGGRRGSPACAPRRRCRALVSPLTASTTASTTSM